MVTDDPDAAHDLAGLLATCFSAVAGADAEQLAAAVHWGQIEAGLVGGMEQLSPGRAQDLTEDRLRHLYVVFARPESDRFEVWRLAEALGSSRPWWPHGVDHALLAMLVARSALTVRRWDDCERWLAVVTELGSTADDLLQADLAVTGAELAYGRGRIAEVVPLLRRGIAPACRARDTETSRRLLGLALAVWTTYSGADSVEHAVAALRPLVDADTDPALAVRIELLTAWGGLLPSAGQPSVDPHQLDRLAALAPPEEDPGVHLTCHLLAALFRLRDSRPAEAHASVQAAYRGLESARRGAIGGFPEGPLRQFCRAVEAFVITAEGDRSRGAEMMSQLRAEAVEAKAWLFAAVWSAALSLVEQADPHLSLRYGLEGLLLHAPVLEGVTSSRERVAMRRTQALMVQRAVDAAVDTGDHTVLADLLELLRAQALPSARAADGEIGPTLTAVLQQATAGLGLVVSAGLPDGREPPESLTSLARPARVWLPWGPGRVDEIICGVDALRGLPPRPVVLLSVDGPAAPPALS